MKVIVDDKIPFIKGAFEPFADVRYLPGGKISRGDALDADALVIRTRTKCNEALLKGTRVRFIATATIGYDHIDTDYCKAAGIQWVNAPGCNSGSVMQYVASALASLSARKDFCLKDKTIGIVGVGNVGSKIARLAEIFGMKVLLNDPPRERTEQSGIFIGLHELLQSADIVSLHVPLIMQGVDKTCHLLNRQTLSFMKDGSILFNTSRGEAVDTSALLERLERGKLKTIIDVWENEPEINRDLLERVDIATPHIAGYSLDGKANGTIMSVRSVGAFFGWGLRQWQPGHVPAPTEPEIILPSGDADMENLLSRAILHTYDIMKDDSRLREHVKNFEKQRGSYPPRREFMAYEVKGSDRNVDLAGKLAALGFRLSK